MSSSFCRQCLGALNSRPVGTVGGKTQPVPAASKKKGLSPHLCVQFLFFLFYFFVLEQCIILASSPNFILGVIFHALQTGASCPDLECEYCVFVLSSWTHIFYWEPISKCLLKRGSSCTWMCSSSLSAGPPWEQGLCLPLTRDCSPPFPEIPFGGTVHTAFCCDAHTDPHAGTSRGPKGEKNTLVIKPRSWKLKRVRPGE